MMGACRQKRIGLISGNLGCRRHSHFLGGNDYGD